MEWPVDRHGAPLAADVAMLTPEKPGEFLAHLAAWGYPVAGLGQQLKEAS